MRQQQVIDTQIPSYFAKIKALGYSIIDSECETFTISPLRACETWKLKMPEDIWVLYVNEIPQIAFQPEEVIKFLVRRKFPQAYPSMSPCH